MFHFFHGQWLSQKQTWNGCFHAVARGCLSVSFMNPDVWFLKWQGKTHAISIATLSVIAVKGGGQPNISRRGKEVGQGGKKFFPIPCRIGGCSIQGVWNLRQSRKFTPLHACSFLEQQTKRSRIKSFQPRKFSPGKQAWQRKEKQSDCDLGRIFKDPL